MKLEKSREKIKTVVKLDLPFTLDGITTAYAEQEWTYATYLETDDSSETTELILKGPLVLLEGKTKENLILIYSNQVSVLEAKCIKETTELNDMIDKLEAE